MATPNTQSVLALVANIPTSVIRHPAYLSTTVQGAVVLSANRLHIQLLNSMPSGMRLLWEDWQDAVRHYARFHQAVVVHVVRNAPETAAIMLERMRNNPGAPYILLEEV